MRILAAVFAIASGAIVLFGYFFPGPLDGLRALLIDWAVIIAGMSVLVGVANLVFVHMQKVRTRQKSGVYSAVLVMSLIVTFGLALVFKPEHTYMQLVMDAIIFPVEASLMAILTITLIYASIRLLRRRMDMMTVIFLVSTFLFLLAAMPTWIGPVPGGQLVLYILNMFTSGGARGLLIGVALGTLFTGLRVLFGIDRPYGGN